MATVGLTQGAALLLCATLGLVGSATSDFVVEMGNLSYITPDGAAAPIPFALANFGNPLYGATVRGMLVYPKSFGDKQCTTAEGDAIDCAYGCTDFAEAVPPMTATGQALHGIRDSRYLGNRAILLIDRGPEDGNACKFTLKAFYAQAVGAQAVIIANYENRLTTMDRADDDETEEYIRNLTIPAAFVKKEDGDMLKAMLADSNTGKYHPFEDQVLMVQMSWRDLLPRAETVNWEFWTNSNDACGSNCDQQKQFIKEFGPIAKQMDKDNVAEFEPHYLIWVCPPSFQDSPQCQSQCIYNGRYCCPDPEDDMEQGYDGKDVILENLRQLCVFELAKASGKTWLWWDYVTRFADECKMSDKMYNEACAEQVFSELYDEVPGDVEWEVPAGFTSTGLSGLRECVGNPDEDVENPLLEAEKDAQVGNDDVSEVSILPTVRINGRQYRGALKWDKVLRGLCSAFPKDNEPDVCNRPNVAPNECEDGGVGATKCAGNRLIEGPDKGKTKCVNTFDSYKCDCGQGWVGREKDGETLCLDMNECRYLSPQDLGPDCTCERCACHNEPGNYHCEPNLADPCLTGDHECWSGEVNGKSYSACVDTITHYKELARDGLADATTALHKCSCPTCFEGDGHTCVPVENFDRCNPLYGTDIFTDAAGNPIATNSGGLGVGAVIGISIVVILVAMGAAFGFYRFQRRSHMDAEIRAIMAQYMPLDKDDEVNGNGGAHISSPRAGSDGVTHRV
mmetsp:Transcript_11383/g.20587  ORF Transcript_11383/g.20587 Transcript_11383/m.20587 type:complete len:737 (-) Transcript_11383:220-2430(-)|eukprot:CAMPEP_0177777410 /NCGR_PEP_ID=MMETSP0491_2-20121128/15348_1 /TAXON_ID=63592 /ORGANISM="Tetraselmis chuii, Strain PLY429" /LENGTH=736 /DNA_ID=CAMNT_0019296499 /DNA_START=220 /DNA_END=2430 /DNA_ORIENTATION=-